MATEQVPVRTSETAPAPRLPQLNQSLVERRSKPVYSPDLHISDHSYVEFTSDMCRVVSARGLAGTRCRNIEESRSSACSAPVLIRIRTLSTPNRLSCTSAIYGKRGEGNRPRKLQGQSPNRQERAYT